MINEKRLLDTFFDYVMIDSETKNEKAMGEKLVEDLKVLGLASDRLSMTGSSIQTAPRSLRAMTNPESQRSWKQSR